MGQDKALLVVDGERLIDRQLDLLSTLDPAEFVISGRAGQEYGCPGVLVVNDDVAEQGPLGGLAAIFAATTSPHVLVVAVDLPAISPYFLSELCALRASDRGAVPRTARGWEPLIAIYPRVCVERIHQHLREGRLAMQDFVTAAAAAGEIKALKVTAEDEPSLVNWNRPEDIA